MTINTQNSPTIDKSEASHQAAKECGFYVEDRGRGPVVYMVSGGVRKAYPVEACMWQKIVQRGEKINQLEAELASEASTRVQSERTRIMKCLNRAAREMSLHQQTLALASEIVSNPNAEIDIFGAREVS